VSTEFNKLKEIIAALETLPNDYEMTHRQLVELRREFHTTIAQILEPKLQTHLALLPVDTYDDKRRLASWTNGQLNSLGLALRDRDGLPSILIADTGATYAISRFRLLSKLEGKRHVTGTWRKLPSIELMAADLRLEAFSTWADRIADSASTRTGKPPPKRK